MTQRIICGNALEVLRSIETGSIQCVVTSPPYWGLRAYGTEPQVWGGDRDCEHSFTNAICEYCGAWRGELGQEPNLLDFIAYLVEIFREVNRVLHSTGTLWLNMGDSYANDTKWGGSTGGKHVKPLHGDTSIGRQKRRSGLKSKDLVGQPWRLAFALQDDGWYLRRDIIWAKSSPMPESVIDRPSTAHEYIFLLTKSPKYYYDFEAIKEPCSGNAHARTAKTASSLDSGNVPGPNSKMNVTHIGAAPQSRSTASERFGRGKGWRKATPGVTPKASSFDLTTSRKLQPKSNAAFSAAVLGLVETRNSRSVWTFASEGYPGAHFATFPRELPRRCILAGSGTTGEIAHALGRGYVLIELQPDYIPLIKKRLSGVTGSLLAEAV